MSMNNMIFVPRNFSGPVKVNRDIPFDPFPGKLRDAPKRCINFIWRLHRLRFRVDIHHTYKIQWIYQSFDFCCSDFACFRVLACFGWPLLWPVGYTMGLQHRTRYRVSRSYCHSPRAALLLSVRNSAAVVRTTFFLSKVNCFASGNNSSNTDTGPSWH